MAQRGTTLTSLRSNNVENEAVGPRGKGAMVPNNRVTRRTAMSEIGNKQGNALQPFGNRTLKNGNFEIIQILTSKKVTFLFTFEECDEVCWGNPLLAKNLCSASTGVPSTRDILEAGPT